MLDHYFSLRYIRVTHIEAGKACQGTFIYCYKIVKDVDNSIYMDFLDQNILTSVQKYFVSAQLRKDEILLDVKWQRWYRLLSQPRECLYMIPSFSNEDIQTIEYEHIQTLELPSFGIELYISNSIYKENSGYPFNQVEFRYPIDITPQHLEFSRNLLDFCKQYVFTFKQSVPVMQFHNSYNLSTFDRFYSTFIIKSCQLWPELKNLKIDVYNNHHLKPFMTANDAFFPPSILNDTPYLSFCFRKAKNGAIENDIIENTDLCTSLKLTPPECFALIAHEIGHFVEKVKQTQFADPIKEESTCDQYAVRLGLQTEIKSALQKILDAKVCSPKQNDILIARIGVL